MGAGVAWRCAQRGAQVTVVERGREGAEASWAAGGMLAPHAEVEFYEDELLALGEASQTLWPDFAAELVEASGVDIGYDTSGSIVVAVDRDEAEANRRLFEYQQSRGLPVAWWTGDACREREPLLSPRIHSGVWSPQDHQVDAQATVHAVGVAARNAGADWRDATVAEVHLDAGAVAGATLASGERVDADVVVIAAGAWSRTIDGLGAYRVPIRPVKGQMLALRADPTLHLRHVIRSEGAYVVPKADRWVIGATSEDRGFDARVTAGGVYQLLEGTYEAVPAALELELVDTWCGFRPACRDNGPVLGGCDVRGLFFCTGHYRHGIQQSPVSVGAVAGAIFGEAMPAAAAAFPIARFR